MWRDTGDCATNHDLSYARSKDLRQWEKSDGSPLALPLTMDNAEVIDPVPAGGGIINGNTHIGFDSHNRVIVSYHKFDADGNTQIYNARRAADGWKIYQTSDWEYRWEFSGGGSIGFEISLTGVRRAGEGKLAQTFSHAKYGRGVWTLDEATLKPITTIKPAPKHPSQLDQVESDYPGMQVKWRSDSGRAPSNTTYQLRWEALGANRDRPRPEPWPAPSMLRVYQRHAH